MSDFKRIPLYVDENKIDSFINPQYERLSYFQTIVDNYNSLELGTPLAPNDLTALINQPRNFIAKAIIKEGSVSIEGLKLDLDKVFDIIEKPIGTMEFIGKIIADNNTKELMLNQRNVGYFEVENGNEVVIKKSYSEEIAERCTVFLSNEKELKAYEVLTALAENINELKKLKSRGQIEDIFFSDFLISNENGNGIVEVNPYFLKNINQ